MSYRRLSRAQIEKMAGQYGKWAHGKDVKSLSTSQGGQTTPSAPIPCDCPPDFNLADWIQESWDGKVTPGWALMIVREVLTRGMGRQASVAIGQRLGITPEAAARRVMRAVDANSWLAQVLFDGFQKAHPLKGRIDYTAIRSSERTAQPEPPGS